MPDFSVSFNLSLVFPSKLFKLLFLEETITISYFLTIFKILLDICGTWIMASLFLSF